MNDNTAECLDEERVRRLERNVSILQDRIRLLEEENAGLENMLSEYGVTVHRVSKITRELPPPILHPSEAVLEDVSLMKDQEKMLLEELCPRNKALLVLKSGSKVDVGYWFRKGAVWVCATPGEIILLAAGPKPFAQKTPFHFLRESLYNHVTAQVVLAPAPGLAMRSFRLSPLDGYQVLAQIYSNNNEEKTK